MEDTICAISTSPGIGAISIVRVSGRDAIEVVSKIFKGKDLNKVESHTIHYGFIFDENEKVDEVLVSVMKAPKTYTKEDIIEINSHGGINTTNKILELLLENGCRLAEAGEFTKRAFLNGRIDLVEAESVNDLIIAKNDQARRLALNNLSGSLTKEIKKLRDKLSLLMANIEVNIDYPEYEDVEVITEDILLPKLKKIREDINEMLINTKNGRIIKEGINIAIVGRPNVGKSSILNTFLDENKAIVTDIEGTTRDIVEGSITLEGFLINFIDTAGIRETKDVVEKIGVEKSINAISNADLVIIVLDNSKELSEDDIKLIIGVPEEKRIIFVNKSDLNNKLNIDYECVEGNTVDSKGLDKLKKSIINKLELDKINLNDLTYMSNIRQIDLLKKANDSIEDAINNLNNNLPVDMVEIDITKSFNYLGDIIGASYEEDLLNTLFSNFCIGK